MEQSIDISSSFRGLFFTDIDNGLVYGNSGSMYTNGGGVDIEDNNIAILPDDTTLFQNYPNPFNSTATIKYKLQAMFQLMVEFMISHFRK